MNIYPTNIYFPNQSFLNNKCVLISLTGGAESENDISAFFDADFPAFLNQRVSAYFNKTNNDDTTYLFYALTKHNFFRYQWLGKGGIQKNTVSNERDNAYIPKIKNSKAVKYVSTLTRVVLQIEKEIRKKHFKINELIKNEIESNQLPHQFQYEFPSLDDLKFAARFDTNVFTPYFKSEEFKIRNYKSGYSSIENLGFEISRGQNLQISNIGESVYSEKHYDGFYTLMLPKHLSRYGTVNKVEYLGNRRELKTLKKGDLIFGAEGFEKGRSIVILDERSRTITNIHGITLHHKQKNIQLSIFIKCFLDYLRNIGLIDRYAVGGNGGSLAMKYWSIIPFPNFPDTKQKEIANLYHNPQAILDTSTSKLTVDNFVQIDNSFNEKAGITELDLTAKRLKERLDEVIDKIVKDQTINITFNFLQI
ncbi:MAG: hypothetical protein HY279_07025 [Nitrospinae bacterium]|nr:hypothetical protein [Nitrospinota bacterium]